MGNKYGYIRISDKSQNEDRQRNRMLELGVEPARIYCDKASGKNFQRVEYQILRRIVSTEDTIYLDSLDRLGRDYDGIISEWKYLTREKKCDIVVLDQESLFDSRKFKSMGDMGRLLEDQFLALLSYVAQSERQNMLRRQAEGYKAARLRGQKFGRPKISLDTLSRDQKRNLNKFYASWKSGELTAVAFARLLELKKNTFYNIIKEYEVKKNHKSRRDCI